MTGIVDKVRRLGTVLTTPRLRYTSSLPVMVICRDRLDPLLELVAWLQDEGLTQIHLIDNDSTYEPLLDYLTTTEHQVIRLGRNVGHTSPWLPELDHLRSVPFIVSDCDVIPDPGSHGAVDHFISLLNRYRGVVKVGFGLHVDDLPAHYARRAEVEAWESQFWERPLADDVYMATLDTTFGLYRPGTPYTLGPALRTGGRFMARHEPWYQRSEAPTDDLAYFLAHANSSTTWWPSAGDDGGYGTEDG